MELDHGGLILLLLPLVVFFVVCHPIPGLLSEALNLLKIGPFLIRDEGLELLDPPRLGVGLDSLPGILPRVAWIIGQQLLPLTNPRTRE